MDRTRACGVRDVGSIPTGSTEDTKTWPAPSLRAFGLAAAMFLFEFELARTKGKNREAGSSKIPVREFMGDHKNKKKEAFRKRFSLLCGYSTEITLCEILGRTSMLYAPPTRSLRIFISLW